MTFIYICGQLGMTVYGDYIRGNVSETSFLPMHTLPFFMNPSLHVHTKEPKVFAQVECSGQAPLVSHSFTSVDNQYHVGIYSESLI